MKTSHRVSKRVLLHLAVKNLWRHGKRTIITASAIAFGLALFIFIDSMLSGAEKDSQRNLIWYETSSLRIYTPEMADEWQKYNVKHLIQNPGEMIDALNRQGITATRRTDFIGEMYFYKDPFAEDGYLQLRVTAVDADSDGDVYPIEQAISQGSWIEKGSNQIVLGQWLAEDIGAQVGYPVEIKLRTPEGAFATVLMEVSGLVNTGNPVINRGTVLMDHSFADDMLLLHGRSAHIDCSFPILRSSAENENDVRLALGSIGLANQDYALLSWEDLGADYLALAATKQGGSKAVLFLVALIALVGITNTMLMAMYERRRELGMMRAMGMGDVQIAWTFTMEAAGIGVTGGVFGLAFGALLTWFLVAVGIDFSVFTRDMDIGYRISTVFRGVWKPDSFIVSFISSVGLSMIISLIPTMHGLKMGISECLHSDT